MLAARNTFLLVCAAFAGAFTPSPARAYRTFSDAEALPGAAVHWLGPVQVVLASDLPSGLEPATFDRELALAVQAWTTAGCALPPVTYLGRTVHGAVSGDGILSVSFVRSGWVASGLDADAAGSTDVLYEVDATGASARLVDADIVLNADRFTWGPLGVEPRAIGPVLRHELGHALGLLAHSCSSTGEAAVPMCDGASPSVMHPLYMPELQSALHPDDVAGLCFVYGVAEVCEPACTGTDRCETGICVPSSCLPGSGTCEACSSDTECGSGFCDGTCRPAAATGEPCAAGRECTSGACTVGRCADACAIGGCRTGLYCAPSGACAVVTMDHGAACTAPRDCESRWCAEAPRTGSFCTVECDGSSECPGGFVCGEADGVALCVPPAAATCSARAVDAHRGIPALLPFFLFVLIARHASRRSS